MSYNSQVLVQCEDLQSKLRDVWGRDGMRPRDPIPFLEYILSPENTNNIQQIIVPGQGKARTINLTYFQRLLESTVTEVSELSCDAGEKRGNCVKSYTIDTTDKLKSSERIDQADLIRFCEDNPTYLAERLMAHLDVIDRKVASKIAAEAAALTGGWSADAVTYYGITNDRLEVATKASGNYSVGAIEEVNQAALMSSFPGFVMFGGVAMNEYLRLTLAGCCADQGLNVRDIFNLYGYAFAYDRRLAAELNGGVANGNLIMAPGALQLLQYNGADWKTGMPIDFNSGYAHFPLTTPAGVSVEVLIKDNCPGVVDINVFATVELVGMPEDLFPVGDNFDGVNYVAEVEVSNS